MLKHSRFYLFILLLTACGIADTKNADTVIHKTDSSSTGDTLAFSMDTSVSEKDTIDYNYASYYIVAADTGLNYYQLHKKMLQLSQQLNQPIDSLDRYYNKAKDSILLPDNYEDDMYAGAYYPRRSPSSFLSIEYFDFFKSTTREKNMVLVTGIYEEEISADSALGILKRADKNAFKFKAKVYVGCMH